MEIEERLPLTDEYLKKMDAYWRAANYLGAAQLICWITRFCASPSKWNM